MHPVLLDLWGFQIHTYGALGALGFLIIVTITMKRSRELGINPDRVVDVIFYTAIAGIVGSRAVYVIQNPEQFDSLWRMVNIRTGGLVFYGALVTGLPLAGYLLVRYKLPFYKLMDVFANAIPLAHAVTRLGCFSAGCCYGLPTDKSWGVTFTEPLSVAPHNIMLHPTQLYEAGTNLIIFGVVNWLYSRKRFDGQVMLAYLSLYAVSRYVNETFRGDATRGYFLENILGETLSYSQGTSLVVMSVAIAIFLVGAKRSAQSVAKKTSAGESIQGPTTKNTDKA